MPQRSPLAPELPATKASSLALRLRADIIRGDFAPGSKLLTQELAARYGVSLIPMREALSRLASSGFVRAQDQRGFWVATTSASELADITSTRLLIEKDALRRSIALGELTWEADLMAAHHHMNQLPMRDAPGQGINRDWDTAHGAFHAALLAGCQSGLLQSLAFDLREQTSRYRHLSVLAEQAGQSGQAAAPPARLRDVAAEHLAILNAALARNADLATDLLAQHLQKTSHLVLQNKLGDHYLD